MNIKILKGGKHVANLPAESEAPLSVTEMELRVKAKLDIEFDEVVYQTEQDLIAAKNAEVERYKAAEAQSMSENAAVIAKRKAEKLALKVAIEKSQFTSKDAVLLHYLNSLAGGDELTPAGDQLVVDNFQDGKSKAPYNLQVRNTTGEAVKFIAVVRDAPYSKIPSLVEGDYSLEITESDAGYTYTFTGTLEAYASITITGGVVSPVGNGKTETSPELYLA